MANLSGTALTGHFRVLSSVRCIKCGGQLVADADSEPGEQRWHCLWCAKSYSQRAVDILEARRLGITLAQPEDARRQAAQ